MSDLRIPVARDLRQDGGQASSHKVPLLLYFSQHACGYCKRLEEEVLVPMLISGDYEDRIILREVSIDEGQSLAGFAGEEVAGRMLFHEYDGMVTPTLVLTDGTGRQLTRPLAGINTVEFFGWYLDNAIDAATQQIRGRKQ